MVVAIMVIVCGHHGHCLWPSWSLFVAVMVVAIMVIVCGHHGCGHHVCGCHGCGGLWPSWSLVVAVMVCSCHGCGRHGLWPSLSNPMINIHHATAAENIKTRR